MHDYWTLMKKLIWLRILQGASFVVNKITGTSPITLTNAINSAIISLKQYGKCVQDGTPTPDAFVGIMCNNGELTMVDDELPVGYKRILGFLMNNNSYWEIPNFKMNGSDTLRFSFEATDACNVIGAYSGSASGNNYSLYVGTSSNYLRYKNGAYNSSVSYNTRYDVEITPTGSSGMKVDSTWTAQTFTTPTNLCIGTTSVTASSAKLKGKLYGNIEVVGRAKFIPCERVSDNVLGYYDTVGETFYEQTSGFAGAVSLGYDGSHYQLSVVGTPEALTVSASSAETQTASVANLFAVGDYKDEQDIINGLLTHRVGIKVLTGDASEEWGENLSLGTVYIQGATASWGAVAGVAPICTRLVGLNSGETTFAGACRFAKDFNVYEYKTAFGVLNITEFKAKLASYYNEGNPIILVYPLATPTTESVTPHTLTTTKGTNVVEVTSNVDPVTLEVEYKENR